MLWEKMCILERVGDILNRLGSQVGQRRNEWLMLVVITLPPYTGVFGRQCRQKHPSFFPLPLGRGDRGGMGLKPQGYTFEPKASGGWAAIYNSGLDLCEL
jgi:hypothetical protein